MINREGSCPPIFKAPESVGIIILTCLPELAIAQGNRGCLDPAKVCRRRLVGLCLPAGGPPRTARSPCVRCCTNPTALPWPTSRAPGPWAGAALRWGPPRSPKERRLARPPQERHPGDPVCSTAPGTAHVLFPAPSSALPLDSPASFLLAPGPALSMQPQHCRKPLPGPSVPQAGADRIRLPTPSRSPVAALSPSA